MKKNYLRLAALVLTMAAAQTALAVDFPYAKAPADGETYILASRSNPTNFWTRTSWDGAYYFLSLADAKADFERQKADGAKQLEDGRKTLSAKRAEVKKQLEDAEKKLSEGKAQYEEEKAKGEKDLNEAEKKYAAAKKDAEDTLADVKRQIDALVEIHVGTFALE